jgi:hypothetical protein
MDLMTGKTYETKEAALADGVPESNLIDLRRVEFKTRDTGRSKYQPHQGTGEIARRLRRAKVLVTP